jgi:hypothetical protein
LKALTVRQPWASLIVAGVKDVENRSKPIKYRGRLAIHSSLRINEEAMEEFGHLIDTSVPLGAIIGSVDVVDCVVASPSQWAMNGYYHWVLANPHQLKRIRPMKGSLGLWTV